MNRRIVVSVLAVTAITLPWLGSFLTQALSSLATLSNFSNLTTVAISGIAVLGASFLLTWGAETAEKDVPRAFAIAVLAVLAVAPEYAVDALYAWNAGQFAGTPAGTEAGNLAVANMTGANRILIGIGWAGIVGFTVLRRGSATDPAVTRGDGPLSDAVQLDRNLGVEVVFLLAATLWALFVPLNGGIDVVDTAFLVSLYVFYIVVVLRDERVETEEQLGVPAYLQDLPKPVRVGTVIALFAYSALIIITAVEPFAHGLEELGVQVGIPSFFMIQWIAPLASESPELIVVLVLVTKARSSAGFNALISSKLNQWTLLIGTLAVVYSLALGHYGSLPFDQKQAGEIWITAAQSFFALTLILNFQFALREAIGLFLLFISQVLIEFLVIRDIIAIPISSYELLLVFSGIYTVLGMGLLALHWRAFLQVLRQTGGVVGRALSGQAQPQDQD